MSLFLNDLLYELFHKVFGDQYFYFPIPITSHDYRSLISHDIYIAYLRKNHPSTRLNLVPSRKHIERILSLKQSLRDDSLFFYDPSTSRYNGLYYCASNTPLVRFCMAHRQAGAKYLTSVINKDLGIDLRKAELENENRLLRIDLDSAVKKAKSLRDELNKYPDSNYPA